MPAAARKAEKRPPARSHLAPQPHGGALKRNHKSTVESTAVVHTGDLVPQPHGGALRNGGTNKGGAGRPASAIRDSLRLSYDEKKAFLTEVIEGKVLVQTQVSLSAIVSHVRCGRCETVLLPADPDLAPFLMYPAKQSASVKDRLAALEQMAKYGMGQLKEVSVENVRARVTETLRIIGLHCDPALAETLYSAIEPVWK